MAGELDEPTDDLWVMSTKKGHTFRCVRLGSGGRNCAVAGELDEPTDDLWVMSTKKRTTLMSCPLW